MLNAGSHGVQGHLPRASGRDGGRAVCAARSSRHGGPSLLSCSTAEAHRCDQRAVGGRSVSGVAGMLTIAAGVTLDARPEPVWELAMDWGRQHEWIWATRVRGGHGVGARVTGFTGIGPVGFTDTMVITQWQPPRLCVVR